MQTICPCDQLIFGIPAIGAVLTSYGCRREYLRQVKLIKGASADGNGTAKGLERVGNAWRGGFSEYALVMSPFCIYLLIAVSRNDLVHVFTQPELAIAGSVLCATALSHITRFFAAIPSDVAKGLIDRVRVLQAYIVLIMMIGASSACLIASNLMPETLAIVLQTIVYGLATLLYFTTITRLNAH